MPLKKWLVKRNVLDPRRPFSRHKVFYSVDQKNRVAVGNKIKDLGNLHRRQSFWIFLFAHLDQFPSHLAAAERGTAVSFSMEPQQRRHGNAGAPVLALLNSPIIYAMSSSSKIPDRLLRLANLQFYGRHAPVKLLNYLAGNVQARPRQYDLATIKD